MNPPALELANLSKNFGGLVATRDVSLSVGAGERHLLIGPNGAGKTTLFNLITGDLSPSAGRIRLFGADATRFSTRARVALGLARTYQVLTLFPRETLLHNVVLALLGTERRLFPAWRPLARRTDLAERALQALATVGLAGAAHRIVGETAYGERRRLELAMALAQEPRLLLLDEPLAGLSREERETIQALLEEIPRAITVVMIEHDMDAALAFAERITLLDRGAVVLAGTRAEVAADPRTREVYLGV
ncbi:MAG TPA: ABC transporter ATP-binding protein [Acetobacteraceae bacterium]|nr:ABC transporter ATP-binding protein [Acetobacteraceae bacterium]